MKVMTHHFHNMFFNLLIDVTFLLASFLQVGERNQRNNLHLQQIVILNIPIAIVYLYWHVLNILHKQMCLLEYASFMFHQ